MLGITIVDMNFTYQDEVNSIISIDYILTLKIIIFNKYNSQ